MLDSRFTRLIRLTTGMVGLTALATPTLAHVTLLAPNGGEHLTVGSQFKIEWTIDIAHNQLNWDLWYSTTGGGGPWIPIAMDLPPGNTQVGSVHNHVWTIPNDPSDQIRVRVRMDNSGTDYYDVSDQDLSIFVGCCGTPYCDPAKVNSSGLPAILEGTGSDVVTKDFFFLHAFQLPPSEFGYPLLSANQGSNPVGNGTLCLGGPIGRFTANVFDSGPLGDPGLIFPILTNLPSPPGGSVMAGETWNFQLWFRDGATSNFTNGLSVLFR